VKFALFYEIPVARPWTDRSEYWAYQNTIEQAVLGDRVGFHAFWTVEHHFLEEYSHCSNPEVLYGAVAALTRNMRIGYGVRLLPKPYNHPVRSAESAAVLDLISGGRVDFGTGRSSTRMELEGFGIHPTETRGMWQEALDHIVGCWTHDEYEFEGKHWSMPKRRVLPKPLQKPHPPLWGATGSPDTHRLVGEMGLGLCSFGIGQPPEEVKRRIDIYREGLAACTKPVGKYVNDQAAAFTLVCVAPTDEEAQAVARESFEWYPKHGARIIASVVQWLAEMDEEAGTYNYLEGARDRVEAGLVDLLTLEHLVDTKAVICGSPDTVVEVLREYERAGVDLLLCLVQPYNIPHEKVLQTIDLMGKHVLKEFQ
jgi:alkanesulfonate monooxygenase SsuD/methylene tetrahydromethanopterin reductase-like flavin-dependent oxidoreductase (luciferase family)